MFTRVQLDVPAGTTRRPISIGRSASQFVLHAAPVVAGFITHKSVMDPATRLFGSDYFASAVLRLLRRAKATASEGITRVGRVAW